MQICPQCGYENPEGEPYCVDCGYHIHGDFTLTEVRTTRAMGQILFPPDETSAAIAEIKPTAGMFALRVGEDIAYLPMSRPLTLGRGKTSLRMTDMFDLDPYDAYHKGVSRSHAEIRLEAGELMIVDLGSMNGTFLNRHRLEPNKPYPLFTGDQIRLATIDIHVYLSSSPIPLETEDK